MKKVLLPILLTLLPLLTSAETVEIDGIWYNLVTKVKEAEVTRSPSGDKYNGDVVIPSSVTYNDVKYSVTSIGEYAFYQCQDLNSVTIPNGVTSICDNAFRFSGLTSVTIPNSVTSIGASAFYMCGFLTIVTIPNRVTYIGNAAFYGCSSLTSVTIPNTLTSISTSTFKGCIELTSVGIGSSVTEIGNSAFQNCSGLKTIIIPSSVTLISNSAFSGCTGLTSLTIPNSVTSIGSSGFSGCIALTSITLGSGLKSIYESAFSNCNDLTDVYCLAEIVTDDNSWNHVGLYTVPDAFENSYPQAMTLHVPAASIEAYRSKEPWSTFKAIVPLEDGETPVIQKCATPEISYENGMVNFTCETEGVEFISSVTLADEHSYYDDKIQLSQKYKISVYATKIGYYNSDTTTREIEIKGDNKPIVVGDVDGDGKVNVADHVKLSDIILNQ